MNDLEPFFDKVSACCEAPVTRDVRTPDYAPFVPYWYTKCTACQKPCAEVYKPCKLDICDGSGVTVQNAGYCGGCERCGSTEEKEVHCPCTL